MMSKNISNVPRVSPKIQQGIHRISPRHTEFINENNTGEESRALDRLKTLVDAESIAVDTCRSFLRSMGLSGYQVQIFIAVEPNASSRPGDNFSRSLSSQLDENTPYQNLCQICQNICTSIIIGSAGHGVTSIYVSLAPEE